MVTFVRNLQKAETVLVFISFWITVFSIRSYSFFYTYIRHSYPQMRIIIHGVHYHHYIVGFLLLASLILFSIFKGWEKTNYRLVLLGVSLGLAFDEFYFWLHPYSENYWVFGNFLAIGLLGIGLWVLVLISHKPTSYIQKLLLLPLLACLFAFFYLANPNISHAKGIRTVRNGLMHVTTQISKHIPLDKDHGN